MTEPANLVPIHSGIFALNLFLPKSKTFKPWHFFKETGNCPLKLLLQTYGELKDVEEHKEYGIVPYIRLLATLRTVRADMRSQ